MHRPYRRLVGIALLSVMANAGLTGVSNAGAVDLFSPASAEDVAGASSPRVRPAAEVRERLVLLNTEALPTEVREEAGKPILPQAGDAIKIELFPDAVAAFEPKRVEPAYGGGTVWTGAAQGDSAILVLAGNAVTGRVMMGGRMYRIEPVRGRTHRIVEIAPGRMRKDGPHLHPDLPPRRKSSASSEDAASASGPTVVTALFAYTRQAKAASRNILSDINLAVALNNEAYDSSSIRIKLRLVGTILVSGYDESKVDYTTTLYNLSDVNASGSGRKAFEPTRKRRNQENADLVVLIREGGEYCGQAWVIESPDATTSGYGFSQVSRDCIEGDTTAHETGHNMGLNHDRYVEPQAPKSDYNYGYVNTGKQVRDIMSYPDKCYDRGYTCEQVTLFSNPQKKVKGQPFGVRKGKRGAADASRRLNETRNGVASYRSGGGTADAAAEAADAREAAAPEEAAALAP